MGAKENLRSLNAKCCFFILFGFSGGRNKNSSMSFSAECNTRCEAGQVKYFANWKFGGGSKDIFLKVSRDKY